MGGPVLLLFFGCSDGLKSLMPEDTAQEAVFEPSTEDSLPDTSPPPEPDDSPSVDSAVDSGWTDTASPDTGTEEPSNTDTAVENPPCHRNIYDQAVDYADQFPTNNGNSWSGWCGSLMFRFANMPNSSARASAILAYADSQIVSLDYRQAPIGAFHWWDIGSYGHVGMDLLGGGGTIFMASNYILEDWGDAIGVTSISRYTSATGASYLGWSMDYAGASMAGGGAQACDADLQYNGVGTVPISQTEETGVPNTTYYMRMQLLASQYSYTGPVDGILGPNSWMGVQRYFVSQGYSVSITGTPDSDTYAAMQSTAAQYGYTGPVDGILGPNSHRGFARFLNETL